ncbi:hypothetical protein [uncultured Williamsia sp.]|uniref:hypothetical protein n=1 Tax=uncultured Williamsia sp. TaxID=259311 RepID=UPI002636344E|nr:hypothetical protein [uncultured Williamsia sp.]
MPSWGELVGRNAAAEAVHVAGTLVVTESPDEAVRYDFHHAPGGRWRIDQDGQTIYVAGPAGTVARVDEEMRVLDGRIRMVMLGTQFTPLDLLGADSMLGKMSSDVRPVGDARPVEVGGRSSWSVPVAAPGQATLHISIDDATGIVARVSDDDRTFLQLDEISELTSSSDALFEWDGPVGEPITGRPKPSQDAPDLDEEIAFTRAMVTAQELAGDVMAAMSTARGESEARAALAELLDVPDHIADPVAAARISLFRADMAAQTRRTLRTLEENRRAGI